MAFDHGVRFVPGQKNQTGGIQVNFPAILEASVLYQFERKCIFKEMIEHREGRGKSTEVTMQAKLKAQQRFPSQLNEPRKAQNGNVAVQNVLIENEDEILSLISDWEQLQRTDSRGMALMDKKAAELVSPLAERLDSAIAVQLSLGATFNSSSKKPTLTHEPESKGYATEVKIVVGNGKKGKDVEGTALGKAIYSFASAFDVKDIPFDRRYVAISPVDYNKVIEDATTYINKDLDGAGSISEGQIRMIGGVNVYKTNSLIKENITAAHADWGNTGQTNPTATWNNSMVVDNSKLVGVAWHPEGGVYCEWSPLKTHVTGSDPDFRMWMGGTMCHAALTYGVKYLRESACARIVWSET